MVKILGIDEAGRGPIIASMYLVGVLGDETVEEKFKQMGVKDSKLLTHKKRCLLEGKIKDLALKVKIIQVKPEEIDMAVDGGKLNLNWLEAHKQAEIINELKPDKVIIDCPSPNIKKFKEYLLNLIEDKRVELVVEHKADKNYFIVGAASIIAKCEREKEVAELKKKYGDFGSLPFDEKIWVVNAEGFLASEKIGNLVENINVRDFNVPSLDQYDFKVKNTKINYGFKHSGMDIYKVYFDNGNVVELSPNHPLFTISPKVKFVSKPLYSLEGGDYVAFAAPKNKRFLKTLELFDLLKFYSTKNHPLYLKSDRIKQIIKNNADKLLRIAKNKGYKITSLSGWLKSSMLPLHLVDSLNVPRRLLIVGKIVSCRGNALPCILRLTKDICWFFGIYLSEGCLLGDYCVDISNQDLFIRKKIIKIAKKYKFSYNKTGDSIRFNSILLNRLISSLHLGARAREKQINPLFYKLSMDNIKILLQGIYDGDGYYKDGSIEIEVYSRILRNDIVNLELILGNICSMGERKNRTGFLMRKLSKSTNSLSKDNIPSVIGSYLKMLRLRRNIGLRELERKCNTHRNVLVKIEKQKVAVISKKILRRINKVLKDFRIEKLINSNIFWIRIIKAIPKNSKEVVYDLEVRPSRFQNFLSQGGLLLHNSGYMADPKCKKFVKENFEKHSEIFRKSWIPFKEAVNNKKQKKLDEF